jgi:hypothetical protein
MREHHIRLWTCLAVMAAGAALMWMASARAAQSISPPFLFPTKPAVPSGLNPNGATNGAAVVRLRWQQGGLYATQPQPPAAEYFRVCVDTPDAAPTCDAPLLHCTFAAADAAIHRTPVASPWGVVIPSRYAYWFELPSQSSLLDRSLRWTVAACATQSASSCNYAAATPLLLSTRNLKAENLEETITSQYFEVTAILSNTGTSASGTFKLQVGVLEALLDAGGTCATSLGSDAVEPGDIAVTRSGQFIRLQSTDIPGTVGVFRESTYQILLGETQTMTLSAGTTTSATPRATDYSLVQLPVALIVTMMADDDSEVAEYDETDNARAECHVVYP